jgi:hypothetical protein
LNSGFSADQNATKHSVFLDHQIRGTATSVAPGPDVIGPRGRNTKVDLRVPLGIADVVIAEQIAIRVLDQEV